MGWDVTWQCSEIEDTLKWINQRFRVAASLEWYFPKTRNNPEITILFRWVNNHYISTYIYIYIKYIYIYIYTHIYIYTCISLTIMYPDLKIILENWYLIPRSSDTASTAAENLPGTSKDSVDSSASELSAFGLLGSLGGGHGRRGTYILITGIP